MKKILGLLLSAILLQACSTTRLVRYEEGAIVESQRNLKVIKGNSFHNVSFRKNTSGKIDKLEVVVNKNDPEREEWEDIYQKVGVYEQQCRAWRGEVIPFSEHNSKREEGEYCTIPKFDFVLWHVFLLGFIYDISIPFQSYDEKVLTITEIEKGTIVRAGSRVIKNQDKIQFQSLKLTINEIASTSKHSENDSESFVFDFSTFKLNPKNLPNYATAKITFGDQELDVSTELTDFFHNELSLRAAASKAEEEYKKRPETKYKMNFCPNADLFNTIYSPEGHKVVSDCIYVLAGPLKIIQNVRGGILVGPAEVSSYLSNKVIFVKTKKQHVDDDFISPMFVHSSGIFNYSTVMGSGKSVHSFQYLGDAKLVRDANGQNQLAPDQD